MDEDQSSSSASSTTKRPLSKLEVFAAAASARSKTSTTEEDDCPDQQTQSLIKEAFSVLNITVNIPTTITQEALKRLQDAYISRDVHLPMSEQDVAAVERFLLVANEQLFSRQPQLESQPQEWKVGRLVVWEPPSAANVHYDILKVECDALMNPTNRGGLGCYDLQHNCLDQKIARLGGPGIREDCRQSSSSSKTSLGWAFATSARAFPYPVQCIVHCNEPHRHRHETEDEQICMTYRAALDTLHSTPFSGEVVRFAVPLISTRAGRWPVAAVKKLAVQTIQQWLDAHPESKLSVLLVIY